MMERARRFPLIASLRTGAAISGFAAVVLLAPAGAGPWALIAQQIIIALVQCVGAILLSGFRPLSPLKRVPLGDHLGFAGSTIGVSVLMTAQRQIPMMLIGYVYGAASLGYYSMSQRIQNLPLQSVGAPFARVAYVHMSAVQEDPARIGDIYVRGTFLMGLAILPPMAVLVGVGDTAFALLLSETWRPAATIFALAAPGIALETATSHGGVLFQAVNRSGLRLRMVAERTCLRLVLVAAALPFGVEAVAASITVAALLFLPRLLMHVSRVVPLDKRAALIALLGPVIAGLLLFAGGRWIQMETSGWTTLLAAAAMLAVVWGAVGLIMRNSLRGALTAFSG
jgi:O-antigen/teichoic acid export membrane protein